MQFLGYLFLSFVAAHLYKTSVIGLIPVTDRAFQRALGLSGADEMEVLRRRPRAAAAWNYFQAVSVGSVYSLVLLGIRNGYISLGGEPWLYSLGALLMALNAGRGFKIHPGSVFVSSFLGVVLGFFIGWWGPLAAWFLFLLVVIPILRRPLVSQKGDTVVIDVDADS